MGDRKPCKKLLDAMDGKGRIWCQIYKQNNYVYIELSDTGHGIPSGKFKSIFNPGYSTKSAAGD